MTHTAPPETRLRHWQTITVGVLFSGYAGYYVCRSNLSVAGPLLQADPTLGVDAARFGDLVSAGVLAYAVGKLVNGVLADLLGGRLLFLLGLFGSVGCTLVLSQLAPASAGFFAAWMANRFVQSMGWGGVVQLTARWFPADRLGTVMGVLCMSYLLGDAAARWYLGRLVESGADWRQLFLASAATLALIGVACLLLLRSRPSAVGLPELPPPPDNLYGDTADTKPATLRALVGPLVRSPAFWLVCLMNAGLTFIRETFNSWNPTYLKQAAGFDPGAAGKASMLFPLTAAGAALLGGWLTDRGGGRFGPVVVPSLVGLVAVLATVAGGGVSGPTAVALNCGAALFLAAPYTFCSGVMAARLGGGRGGATTAGLIDTAGYIGALACGSAVGRVVAARGWEAAFAVMAVVAGLTLVAAGVFAVRERRGRV